jgi:hypothetical protein
MGYKMYVKQEIQPGKSIIRGFPLPKPNINGICDNQQQPDFMEN